MSQTCVYGVLAALVLGLTATSAVAHPKLKSAVPAANIDANASQRGTSSAPKAQAGTVPKEIRLIFSEGVIANLSGLKLTDEAGKLVATGAPLTDPYDRKQLVVPISAVLTPGRYNVTWHAVSKDTHRVKGQYNFTVGR